MKKVYYILLLTLLGCSSNQRDFPNKVMLHELKKTSFAYTSDQELGDNKNYIYSPTLLYAWNHLISETKSSLLHGGVMANSIDKTDCHLNSLNEDEYNKTFNINDNFIIATSSFAKSLPFKDKFTRNNRLLKFDYTAVESFGCDNCDIEIRKQIRIIYYKNDSDFALSITPKDTVNEILIYKPHTIAKSLIDNYNELIKKKSETVSKDESWKREFGYDDIFEIPILSFNLESQVEGLVGSQLLSDLYDTLVIESAMQRTALIFDEKGAEVESEAKIVAKAVDFVPNKPKPKELLFDKPYLLVFKKKSKTNPYLMIWVNNSELMKEKTDNTG